MWCVNILSNTVMSVTFDISVESDLFHFMLKNFVLSFVQSFWKFLSFYISTIVFYCVIMISSLLIILC